MHLVQWKVRSLSMLVIVLLLSLLFGRSCAKDGHERLPLLYCTRTLANHSRQPVHVRVKDLLSRMTLEEKIGQMTQLEKTASNSPVLENYKIGSVFSSAFPTAKPGNFATAVQWANITDSFQSAVLQTRLSIPLIYGIDTVHGHNSVFGATMFPHNVGLGCTREPELLRRIGSATALEVRATGIQYVLGPSIAVCRDPRWGRCYQSFREDPEVVMVPYAYETFTAIMKKHLRSRRFGCPELIMLYHASFR